jgi:hypothetical protein
MHEKYTDTSTRKSPRCPSCAQPMQLLRRTARFGGLPDVYSFYCCVCDRWHVEEGDGPPKQLPDHLTRVARTSAFS